MGTSGSESGVIRVCHDNQLGTTGCATPSQDFMCSDLKAMVDLFHEWRMAAADTILEHGFSTGFVPVPEAIHTSWSWYGQGSELDQTGVAGQLPDGGSTTSSHGHRDMSLRLFATREYLHGPNMAGHALPALLGWRLKRGQRCPRRLPQDAVPRLL
ncbi:hypothetical protein LX36DRAFT_91410 [Colletotrichum falcatum]|nr:hypothetical protein LX36DRAFT_91410 [Colletotrichum falcatum]